MNQVQQQPQQQKAVFSLQPSNLQEAMSLAELMANSEMVPKDFRGKPGNVLVAVQMGAEVGLAPMQAIQNIAVINGRPSIWGDAVKAIILNSPLCEKFEENFDEQSMTAWVTVKRKGHAERQVSFSQGDAQAAGLWGKQGPWSQYPKRMLAMRARGFASRDEFADVLKGLSVAEEQMDIAEKDVTPSSTPTNPALNTNETVSPDQVDALINAAKNAGLDEDYVCKVGNVEKLADLQAIRFEPAMKHLKSKIVEGEIQL